MTSGNCRNTICQFHYLSNGTGSFHRTTFHLKRNVDGALIKCFNAQRTKQGSTFLRSHFWDLILVKSHFSVNLKFYGVVTTKLVLKHLQPQFTYPWIGWKWLRELKHLIGIVKSKWRLQIIDRTHSVTENRWAHNFLVSYTVQHFLNGKCLT